jgi:hypothetical protein
MKMLCAAVHESGIGTKRTCGRDLRTSVLGGKVDLIRSSADVAF